MEIIWSHGSFKVIRVNSIKKLLFDFGTYHQFRTYVSYLESSGYKKERSMAWTVLKKIDGKLSFSNGNFCDRIFNGSDSKVFISVLIFIVSFLIN